MTTSKPSSKDVILHLPNPAHIAGQALGAKNANVRAHRPNPLKTHQRDPLSTLDWEWDPDTLGNLQSVLPIRLSTFVQSQLVDQN